MKILCKLLKTNETLEFNFEPQDATKKLLSALSQRLSVSEDLIRLICVGALMKADKTLEENKVSETTVINVTLKKGAE